MDDAPNPPIHFANRIVRQFVDHLFGPDMLVLPEDFTTLRLAFRVGGGSWERLLHGDITHTRFLEELLIAWGGKKERIRRTEMF